MQNTNWKFLFVIIWLTTSCVKHETNQTAKSEDDLISIGTRHKLFSTSLDENREFWVYLPEDYYDTVYAPYSYPVLYFLDGDRHFHSLTGVHHFLSSGPYTSLPEMIMVGILNTDRARDLTPTHHHKPDLGDRHSFPTSGGGENFIKFIEHELMPKINSNYRTNGYQLLIGHSFGGLTTLHTLLTRPELFNAYIAIDPSVWWDNFYILKKARKTLDSLDLSGRSLYLAQANKHATRQDTTTEHERGILAFEQTLLQTNSELRWQYRFFDDEDHGTIPLPAEYYGLRFIYEGFQTEVKAVVEDHLLIEQNYQELSEKLGFEIQPAESLIDWIGNYAKRTGNTAEAKALFETNARNYPHSSHAQKAISSLK